MGETVKYTLDESRLPEAWYNIAADLPKPPAAGAPSRARGQPVGPDDLAPLFPMELIMQEVSRGALDRDPGGGPRHLPAVAADAALPRAPPREGARTRRRASTTSTRASARRAATSRTPPSRRRTTTSRRASSGSRPRPAPASGARALAFAGSLFGLECKVYMVRVSYDQKPYRRALMETFGARCVPSPSEETAVGPGDPRRASRLDREPRASRSPRRSRTRRSATTPSTRSARVLNHVLLHQTVIGQEAHRADGAGRRLPGRRDRLRRRRLELRRARLPVHRRQARAAAQSVASSRSSPRPARPSPRASTPTTSATPAS